MNHQKIARQAAALGLEHFKLDLIGHHGPPHWQRVWQNCQRIASEMKSGADLEVCAWFSFLHDCKRENDGHDPEHGPRVADWLGQEWRSLIGFGLEQKQVNILTAAIRYHSDGLIKGPLEARVCWDADRLDLPRVGVLPDPKRMSTTVGKKMAERLPEHLELLRNAHVIRPRGKARWPLIV